MDVVIRDGNIINGSKVCIPASKSHSIRAIFIAGLAKGDTKINNLLISADVISAIDAMKKFGALVEVKKDYVYVSGVGGNIREPKDEIDVGNSGTTLRFAMMVAAIIDGVTTLTGDDQIKRRPIRELVELIINLGGRVEYLEESDHVPIKIHGRIKGGESSLDALTSQYLSATLISCPLLTCDTKINLTRLNEVPYVNMTMWWLDKQNIKYINNLPKDVTIFGGQSYRGFNVSIAGDYSQATFFVVLAAISGKRIVLKNLKRDDVQGDKRILDVVSSFGVKITWQGDLVCITGGELKGRIVDMNDIPDALPALAVLGCFAEGETKLINVEQARYKETDRIHVMCEELSKLGGNVREISDGLIIKKSELHGGIVDGHRDHRIVMALSVLGTCVREDVVVKGAESVDITFPNFFKEICNIGGRVFCKVVLD